METLPAQPPQSLEALNRLMASSPPMVPGSSRAVLGEGPMDPPLAFVGEQPGDREDRMGRPFVGPAGQMLDAALTAAGIARAECYLTNAVKHFKFVPRGRKRIHAKPTAGEVKHYRWWLDLELGFVRPRLIVALGATAALALCGKAVAVSAVRGPADLAGRRGFITVHPAFLLRLPGAQAREAAFAGFVADLAEARVLAVA